MLIVFLSEILLFIVIILILDLRTFRIDKTNLTISEKKNKWSMTEDQKKILELLKEGSKLTVCLTA